MPDATYKSRNTTLTTRIPVHLKQRWQRAAAIRGVTLTDFMITAANNATNEIFTEEERITLSQKAQAQLTELLDRPPQINQELRTALDAWAQHQIERMNYTCTHCGRIYPPPRDKYNPCL